MTTEPNVHDAKQRAKLKIDIEQFKEVVEDADVVCVGADPEYVPDCPRLQKQIERNSKR